MPDPPKPKGAWAESQGAFGGELQKAPLKQPNVQAGLWPRCLTVLDG